MVSTPVGDFIQSIAEPQTGIVVPEISASALKEGIQSLFEDDKLKFIAQQIEKEKVALSWETLTKKLLSFINQLV
jgi:glycosyltransferase involved in cell wall biosynthesis